MPNIFRPFDTDKPLNFGCTCGQHATQSECDTDPNSHVVTASFNNVNDNSKVETVSTDLIEAVVVKTISARADTPSIFKISWQGDGDGSDCEHFSACQFARSDGT